MAARVQACSACLACACHENANVVGAINNFSGHADARKRRALDAVHARAGPKGRSGVTCLVNGTARQQQESAEVAPNSGLMPRWSTVGIPALVLLVRHASARGRGGRQAATSPYRQAAVPPNRRRDVERP